MLLILEIILTVTAWRRGWKAWALAPMAVSLSIGFVIGAVIGASGGSVDTAVAVGLLLDLTVVGALVAMVASPRTAEQGAEAVSGAAELGKRTADGIAIEERTVEVMSVGGQGS